MYSYKKERVYGYHVKGLQSDANISKPGLKYNKVFQMYLSFLKVKCYKCISTSSKMLQSVEKMYVNLTEGVKE